MFLVEGRSMFLSYRRILAPPSILDVVDDQILRSLMQAFFYRQRTGLTMLYDTDQQARIDGVTLERMDPFAEGSSRNTDSYHPFCAEFRKDPAKNLLCQECDERRARLVYKMATPQAVS